MLKRSFLFNLLLIILIIIGLLLIFFKSLNWLTNHGQETKVPDLQGKNMKEAVKILKEKGFKIQIDSTYQSYKNPLEVIYQEPEVGAVVKIGRTIFLTVNRKTVPTIPMPNLTNLSFRNALLTMQSYRLLMGDTTYRPDLAAGSVLEQWLNGKQIKPGTPVPYGSKIDLVIGEGLSDMLDVPNLIGMSWYEAKQMLESLSLNYNILWEGAITDSMGAVVYKQTPESLNELDFKNSILIGDMLDVHIMQSPSQELLEKNKPGSAKLIGEGDSNATEAQIDVPIRNVKDSLPKRKPTVPGTNVPNNAKAKEDPLKKADNKKTTTDVKGQKPGDKKTPSRSTAKPPKDNQPPVKKKDDKISDEFE